MSYVTTEEALELTRNLAMQRWLVQKGRWDDRDGMLSRIGQRQEMREFEMLKAEHEHNKLALTTS